MKFQNYIATFLIGLGLMGCNNTLDEINTNPDATTEVTPSLLATGVLLDMTQLDGYPEKDLYGSGFIIKQLTWGERVHSYIYNIFDRASFASYKSLLNAQKMVECAPEDEKNAYDALAHFVKAYRLFYVSMRVGDSPYEDALKGEEGLIKPTYNTQKEVMQFVLNDLEKSYELFSAAKPFEGDPILNGDIEKWKKVVTAFELKVLMNLSHRESDTDLRIKERFASLVASRPLMESNSDNFQLVYADKSATVYPLHYTQVKHAGYTMLTNMLIDKFKETEDPRLFYYAEPAASKLNEGLASSDWDAYIGVDPSDPYEVIKMAFTTGEFCGLNHRYTDLPTGQPLIHVGYSEQNFILAEAVVRGWISGDASAYYKKAIRGSLDFISENTPDEEYYHHGHPLNEEAKSAFLESSKIQLGSDKEANIEKIITQRYLDAFMEYPIDPYYDYRRTGYPKLPINVETNQNPVHDKIPVRWMYPKSEYDYNAENVVDAVARQYGGVDDINKEMWILQK